MLRKSGKKKSVVPFAEVEKPLPGAAGEDEDDKSSVASDVSSDHSVADHEFVVAIDEKAAYSRFVRPSQQ